MAILPQSGRQAKISQRRFYDFAIVGIPLGYNFEIFLCFYRYDLEKELQSFSNWETQQHIPEISTSGGKGQKGRGAKANRLGDRESLTDTGARVQSEAASAQRMNNFNRRRCKGIRLLRDFILSLLTIVNKESCYIVQ